MGWISIAISSVLVIAQISIAIWGYRTIHRRRVIYRIETDVLRLPHGAVGDIDALKTEHINKKLSSGKYTILQMIERHADGDIEIIYGQIKE